jgi:hypothetical protein
VHFVSREGWVFLLDGANLALHEAGHPVVGLFSERLMVYGGTIFQLLFPALFAHHFWRRRQAPGFAAMLLWLAESLMNVGRYMKDARAQALPLVGGGEHDWTEIFGRFGVLAHDVGIGNSVRLLGLALLHRQQRAPAGARAGGLRARVGVAAAQGLRRHAATGRSEGARGYPGFDPAYC